MIKLYVLVYGLVAVVPHYQAFDGQEKLSAVTLLVIDADQATTRSGHKIPDHESKVVFMDAEGGSDTAQLDTRFEEIEISLAEERSALPLTIDSGSGDRLLWLEDLYPPGAYWSPEEFAVKSACRSGDRSQCTETDDTSRSLLAGRIHLAGGWTIRGVEIDAKRNPAAAVEDDSDFGFIAPGQQPPKFGSRTGPLAGAVLFEAEVPEEDFTVEREAGTDGPRTMAFTPKTGEDCEGFGAAAGDRCVRIVVGNLPRRDPMEDTAVEALCNDPGPDRIDTHMDRVYEILEETPSWRFVPYLFELDRDACRELHPAGMSGDPPRIKCPVSFLGTDPESAP